MSRSLTHILLLCIALAAVTVCTGEVAAQARTKKVFCGNCKDRGSKPCKVHKKKLAWEKGATFCSVVAACSSCAGVMHVDCPACSNGPVEDSADARCALVAKWRAEKRETVGQYLRSKKLLYARSEHFDLTFSLSPMRVGKRPRKRSTHELMHIYLDRMEASYARFCRELSLTDEDFTSRADIHIFQKSSDHMEISPRKTGLGASFASGQKFMGHKMVLSMWKKRPGLRDDADVHRYLIHQVTHLLVNHMAPPVWLYDKHHGWLDVGLAHWFEYQVDGSCPNYCYEEIAPDDVSSFNDGRKWKAAVRKLLVAKKNTKFTAFYTLNTDMIGLQVHAECFAHVDFLMTKYGGAKMRDLLRLVKNKVATRDALKKVYGLTPLTIDAEFRKWALKTYPRK